MSAPFNEEELTRRRPVWSALSDLFLDTDHALFYDSTANALRVSGFGADEARMILTDEIGPVLYTNLLSIAGEWAMFPDDWLEGQILTFLAKPIAVRRASVVTSRIVIDHILKVDWPPIHNAVWGAS